MDPDVSVMLSVPSTHRIDENNTTVKLDVTFNRKFNVSVDDQIDFIWKERTQQNSKLFNGSKFRLDSAFFTPEQSAHLNLGLTSYKDFIGTNWSPKATDIQISGTDNCNNSQAYMSDAMGVGAFVQTSDDCVVFLKRSMHCAEASGMWDIPGGHPEPQELVGKIPIDKIDFKSLYPEAVISEIYNSVLREITEEVNIPESTLSRPVLIGIARNNTSAGRPSAEFLVRCSMDSSTILHLYHEGIQAEAYESTNIKLVSVKDMLDMKINDKFWNDMAPSAKGCIILYRLYVNKESSN